MAFTTQDLAAIDAAIATGELTIRASSDGRMITMRSMGELLQARAAIVADIAASAPASQRRPYPRHQLADFSD